MKTAKKVFKMLMGMAIGAAIGYGGAMLVLWLVGGELPSSGGGSSEGVVWSKLLLSVAMSALGLLVGIGVNLVLHEAGHLVAGLLTGYRFLSFRVGTLTLVKTPEGLRWKRFHIAGTGGQCLLDLPEEQEADKMPWFWYNAGGVAMNLAVAAACVALLRLTDPGMAVFALTAMVALMGLAMALMNGIPVSVGGISNDGHNVWTMWRHPQERRYLLNSLHAVGHLSRGHRLGEAPEAWTHAEALTEQSSLMALTQRNLYMERLIDTGRLEEARRVGEELMGLGERLPQIVKMEVGGELVMLELLTSRRREVVERLWTKELERYTRANSKYSPMKCAVLYAYELLYAGSADSALQHKRLLEEHASDFTMPGEALTALELTRKAESLGRENL